MYTSVAKSYENQSVFITGGTGFLGKALLEKLLFSCPDLNKVYLLIREKKNNNAQQRIQKILESPLFSRLKNERPQYFKKIIPIVGDISEENLGMSDEDHQILINNVSIVFHVAASVKFNEPLKVAMNVNVNGTERVLDLSKRMKNIKVFVYVSSVYANSNNLVIEEVVYPEPASLHEVSKLLEIGITEQQIKELIGKRPNIYTFTKALAENLVAKNHGIVPSVILRPSIVSASLVEPVPGWLDSWYGATGVMITISKGLTRVFFGDPTNKIDLIPVDYVINSMIVVATKCEDLTDVAVYNCSTSGENAITIGQLVNLFIEDSNKHKFYDIPMPFTIMTQKKWLLFILKVLLQTIPAYIIDIFLLITGKSARFKKVQAKISLIMDTLEYVTSNSWNIHATKLRCLAESLSIADKHQFPCDPTDIKWDKYIPIYCQGIRQFLYEE